MAVVKDNLLVRINGTGVMVTDAQLSLTTATQPRRLVNSIPEWGVGGPMETTISINGMMDKNWAAIIPYLTGEVTGVQFTSSDGTFSDFYMEECEIRGTTHSPISLRASFRSWSTGQYGHFVAGYGLTGAIQTGIYHSSQSSFNSSGVKQPDEFSYKVQSERVARIKIGEYSPTVRLARLEKELTFQAKNVPDFLSYSGGSGSASFILRGASVADGNLPIKISGKVASQDFKLNDLLETTITIKEFLR